MAETTLEQPPLLERGMPPLVAVHKALNEVEAELERRGANRRAKAEEIEATLPASTRPLLRPARYKGAHGGRGGAKSHSLARILCARALRNAGTRWLCVREIQLSLAHSVRQLLKDVIDQFGLEAHGFKVLESRIETPGGGVFIFQGMQNHTADSVKSFEGFDGAWVEEAHSFSKRSLDLLRPTIRKPGSELWFSWNPDKPSDPVDAFFRGGTAPADSIVISVSWKDNPYFPAVLAADMTDDRARDAEGAAHIWDGQYATRSKASVFKNISVRAFDTPVDATFLLGADWGFAIDPTVMARTFDRPLERRLYIDYEVWQVGCEIDDTAQLFDNLVPEHPKFAREWECRADSARPETISYMNRHGYPRIVRADKGPNSVEEGVKFLQNFLEIVIHPRCIHVAEEFMGYRYKVHPLTGDVMPILEDKKNHTVDSVRYAIEKLRKVQGVTW